MAHNQETLLDDYSFLVSETDARGILKFANEDFCTIAGFTVEELIGKPHSLVRHNDMPRAAFKDLWQTVQRGDIWDGYVKNATKDGGYYWVYATVYPFESSDGSKGYLSCRRKATREEIDEHTALYKQWKMQE